MIASAASTHAASRERASTGLSMPGILGCYFGFRVCLTFLFFQSDPQAGALAGFAVNLLWLVPVVLYAFGPSHLPLRAMLTPLPVRLSLGFLALALVSLAWSETTSKPVALAYWMALATDVALILLLSRTDGAEHTTESLLKGYLYGVFLLCVVAWAAPAMQDLRLGDDEFLTPNAIGFECAFGVLLCQYFAPRAARWKWLGALLAVTLVRSLSKTSIAAFVVVETIYLLRTASMSRRGKISIAAGFLLLAAAFSSLLTSYYAIYTNTGNQADTLTGRTSIWLVTLGLALEHPWLGYGFHAYRNVVPAFGAFQPWHAHNELLQQFFAYGVVGVSLVIALYTSFFRLCRRYRSHPFALTASAVLLLVIIRGLADTERFDLSFPIWAIVAMSLMLATGRREIA